MEKIVKKMTLKHLLLLLVFPSMAVINNGNNWIIEKHNVYNLVFTSFDTKNTKEYNRLVENGMVSVKSFFHAPYKKFNVFIHPNRHSLDSSWRRDWNMPDFKSECWMVASGTATKLDVISPKLWDKEACEHRYSDTKKTQQLIIHELVHVFHGQQSASTDFSNGEGIDWFIEGLATYASGQCDSLRIAAVKKTIHEEAYPKELDKFWSGELKYGLSGSVVMFIDNFYGRTKLKELLPLAKKSDILSALNSTEAELINNCKKFLAKGE